MVYSIYKLSTVFLLKELVMVIDFEDNWEENTFSSYPDGADIRDIEKYENGKKLRPLSERWVFSFSGFSSVVWSTIKIIFVLVFPHLLVMLFAISMAMLLFYSPFWFVVILATETTMSMLYHALYRQSLYTIPMKAIDHFICPMPPNDATAGLYYDHNSNEMKTILSACQSLTSRFAVDASLFLPASGENDTPIVHRASSGFLSGGMRSVLPFVLFQPPKIDYKRRWLRVPIARGPRNVDKDSDLQPDLDCDAQFESVAIDWSPAPGSKLLTSSGVRAAADSKTTFASKSRTVYLILAGLTGGSQEGYVKDFVHHANALGHDCFVMIARGLEESNPCHSTADFHGARLSDAETAARTLRACLDQTGENYSLFMVGFSLGAIIVANLISKGNLLKPNGEELMVTDKSKGKSKGRRNKGISNQGPVVNGAVSIAGALEPTITLQNTFSLKYWLPVLTFGLKDMVSNSYGNLAKSSKRLYKHLSKVYGQPPPSFGSDAERAAHEQELFLNFLRNEVDGVCDFDGLHLARYHGFKDVHHYYQEMTSEPSDLATCATPLLVLAAMDDPVLHVNTVSTQIPKHYTSYHDEQNPSEKSEQDGNIQSSKDTEAIKGTGSQFCCLITSTGGHVGWPLGNVLTGEANKLKWKFSSTLVTEFCEAIPRDNNNDNH